MTTKAYHIQIPHPLTHNHSHFAMIEPSGQCIRKYNVNWYTTIEPSFCYYRTPPLKRCIWKYNVNLLISYPTTIELNPLCYDRTIRQCTGKYNLNWLIFIPYDMCRNLDKMKSFPNILSAVRLNMQPNFNKSMLFLTKQSLINLTNLMSKNRILCSSKPKSTQKSQWIITICVPYTKFI